MNTILNGIMRERRGRLQFQCKYQKLRIAVTAAEDKDVDSPAAMTSLTCKQEYHASRTGNKDKRDCKGQKPGPVKKDKNKMKVVVMIRKIMTPHQKEWLL